MTDVLDTLLPPEARSDGGALHRAVLELAGDYVLIIGPGADGAPIVLDASETVQAFLGYSRGELVQRPLATVDPLADSEGLAKMLRILGERRSHVLEATHVRKDGSHFDVEVRLSLVTLEGRPVIVAVERDVTARKRAEAELRQSHSLLSYIISHARSAIAVHDRDLRYVYVSERYLHDYNVREQDVIGKHHYEVFPDLPQKWRDVHQRALGGEIVSAEEDVYPRPDGSVDWTRWECRPWYEDDGAIGGIIVYTEVITERVRAEEERKKLESQLQQAMKMEAVGRLAGGVAHDFNNLLTTILGNVSLAARDLASSHPLQPLLDEVAKAAKSAAALTRQLLAFSRKQILEPRVLDLDELVANLHRMLVRLIGEDVQLETRSAGSLRPVRIDVGQFEQVLVNLAVNARDAMPSGGRLVIETANVDLDEAYCSRHAGATPGQHVMLAVSDTGHGMPEEVKRHLFEPFFTTKPQGRGTGLGLATTFGAVKQAGGSIEVYSEVGQGTTVKLYLPAVDAAAVKREPSATDAEPRGGTETVLLVEDDAGVRSFATRVLRRLGYRVVAAANGREALELCEAHGGKVDLLITDVVMPGMNGRQLAERLMQAQPDVKVLYASGYTENVIVHHGVLEENLSFIGKPYALASLARKVREVLDGAPASRRSS